MYNVKKCSRGLLCEKVFIDWLLGRLVMAAPEKKRKMNTVLKKTFSNWENHEDFDVDVDDEGNIARVRCKVCTSHINVICQEAKRKGLRGNVLDGVLNYVDRVDGAHKSNIMRHTKSGGGGGGGGSMIGQKRSSVQRERTLR